MRFVEDLSRFYGTGEKNSAGQTLEEYLDGYDPRQFDSPANTTDVIVVRCKEQLNCWEQELEVLLIKRANHPGIGFWATPGGFVEMREHIDDGAARELEEETGIKGLPLMQMATWGEYDRDPRWRVITTSYLALVEGDIAVQAGDDAADALWFKVRLEKSERYLKDRACETGKEGACENGEEGTCETREEGACEIWELVLNNEEHGIEVGADVSVTYSGHKILNKKHFAIAENRGLAADHGCLITQALLYLKEQLEKGK